MRHFSADRKHSILSEYARYSRTHGFEALALRHSVPGGAQVIAQWYQQWNRTVRLTQGESPAGQVSFIDTS